MIVKIFSIFWWKKQIKVVICAPFVSTFVLLFSFFFFKGSFKRLVWIIISCLCPLPRLSSDWLVFSGTSVFCSSLLRCVEATLGWDSPPPPAGSCLSAPSRSQTSPWGILQTLSLWGSLRMSPAEHAEPSWHKRCRTWNKQNNAALAGGKLKKETEKLLHP